MGSNALFRSLTVLGLFFWLLASLTHTAAEPEISPAEIDDYLLEKSAPLAGLGSVFLANGLEFDVDPRLVVAIAGAESTFGKFICTDFNAWNWFWEGPCPNSPFLSWEEGIETVTKFLRLSYLNQGYTTIELIGSKYCAEGCEHWVPNVTQFYRNELGGNVNDLGFSGGTSATLAVTGGTYFDRNFGLIGTSFLFNPATPDGVIPFVDITGPLGWNSGNPLRCFRYQPPGTALDRSLCWDVNIPPVTGNYQGEATVDTATLFADFSIDATSQLPAPEITNLDAGSTTVTVDWTATVAARSFLVRINPLPFTGTVTGEMVVSGATRSTTLTGLALTPGAQYQAIVFAFSQDIITPDPLISPFNIGAHGVVFTAPGAAGQILSVIPASLDFGDIIGPGSRDLQLTVQNDGIGTLSGTATTVAPFSIVSGSPFNLGPGESQVITVRFTSPGVGTFESTVEITSNGGNASVPVIGKGKPRFQEV